MGAAREALFVRLPTPLLSLLDDRIRADGRTKQAVVEELLGSQLSVDAGRTTDEIPDDEIPDDAILDDAILDLAGTAALLRVTDADVLARIADGDFPARRFGSEWRCSRAAVLGWLAGTDPLAPHPTGFAR